MLVGSLIYLANLQQRLNHYFNLERISRGCHRLSVASVATLNESAALRMKNLRFTSSQKPRLKIQPSPPEP